LKATLSAAYAADYATPPPPRRLFDGFAAVSIDMLPPDFRAMVVTLRHA